MTEPLNIEEIEARWATVYAPELVERCTRSFGGEQALVKAVVIETRRDAEYDVLPLIAEVKRLRAVEPSSELAYARVERDLRELDLTLYEPYIEETIWRPGPETQPLIEAIDDWNRKYGPEWDKAAISDRPKEGA